ncbi:MAG: threonine synthase [Bacteroidales bacterium]|nr:threonine synthase [Bacteroidales bacterium]
MTSKFIYQCSDCGKHIPAGEIIYLCPDCSTKQLSDQPPLGVLKVIYDYKTLSKLSFRELEENDFIQLLPVNDKKNFPNLRVGKTPLYEIHSLNGQTLDFELYLKDDSQNPSFSFKDRASAVVSAFAKENGIDTIVAASTGNAGSSLAGMCAAQGQKAVIFVPSTAPKAKLTQIVMYGATLVPVAGNYDKAFDLSIEATKRFGWYNRNTAFNPFTIEGKKTVSFELYSQLHEQIPDYVFVPVGDGVIISGVFKGFEDLLEMGIIEKMPVIIAVQAARSSNLVDNIGKEEFVSTPSETIADSISVDIPRNFHMAAGYITKYHGQTITVSDDDILRASSILSKNTGIFTEPAAAAAFAGFLDYKNRYLIPKSSTNVVLLTGCGLKDLNAVQSLFEIPMPVSPDMHSVEQFLNGKI